MNYRFGLLRSEGPPSRSPELYGELWNGHRLAQSLSYHVLELHARTDWTDWLQQAHDEGWQGFNATIPHKIDIFQCVANRTAAAQAIGATNCLVRTREGWQCHNTDADGFWDGWEAHWDDYRPRHMHAWILGNGGAARAVAYALQSRGFSVAVFARNPRPDFFDLPQRAFHETSEARPPDVVVNATSMGHGVQSEVLPPVVWPQQSPYWAIDLVYGPVPTPFQLEAQKHGAKVLDGMPMLRMQAKKAWEYWALMLGITDF